MNLRKHLFVEKEDVRANDHPKFFGFAPGKIVGIKYAGLVKVTVHKILFFNKIINIF